MNIESKNFRLGYDLFYQDFKYHEINKYLGGTVNNEVYKGFEVANRESKGGYLLKHWSKSGGYTSSADRSTWFT